MTRCSWRELTAVSRRNRYSPPPSLRDWQRHRVVRGALRVKPIDADRRCVVEDRFIVGVDDAGGDLSGREPASTSLVNPQKRANRVIPSELAGRCRYDREESGERIFSRLWEGPAFARAADWRPRVRHSRTSARQHSRTRCRVASSRSRRRRGSRIALVGRQAARGRRIRPAPLPGRPPGSIAVRFMATELPSRS